MDRQVVVQRFANDCFWLFAAVSGTSHASGAANSQECPVLPRGADQGSNLQLVKVRYWPIAEHVSVELSQGE